MPTALHIKISLSIKGCKGGMRARGPSPPGLGVERKEGGVEQSAGQEGREVGGQVRVDGARGEGTPQDVVRRRQVLHDQQAGARVVRVQRGHVLGGVPRLLPQRLRLEAHTVLRMPARQERARAWCEVHTRLLMQR